MDSWASIEMIWEITLLIRLCYVKTLFALGFIKDDAAGDFIVEGDLGELDVLPSAQREHDWGPFKVFFYFKEWHKRATDVTSDFTNIGEKHIFAKLENLPGHSHIWVFHS